MTSKITINIIAEVGRGKTAVSRLIEKTLRDAGFVVTNADPDAPYQAADLDAAVKIASKVSRIDIVTTQAARPRSSVS